ncbi:Protein CBG16873 [Caenorhabditis briggsae]|uniref:MSP domain-containing protein n=2 Tax=Caenorhabditis briggsae TaxID=6238 RepID=A0AAE8ZYU4_CAEBR|nr:Protein CBG16873 [Caenorhabditis briggsae]ULT83345.1 hypothetical protein L3Y34_012528 [Caenorhabditis briggsae]UMM42613.1 hypothetical protein L5515_018373 [Caenorhabditis briggsae]CAP34721.2 Protein CBG16873 [Caenorhabditis briggsae]
MSGADEDALPVLLSTTELQFRYSEKSLAKIVTLYNPFGHAITYKILCTATRNYTVNETTGTLQAKCRLDIVVRCIQRLPVGNIDKLKIEIAKKGAPSSCGSTVLNLLTVSSDAPDQEGQQVQRPAPAPPANQMTSSMMSDRGNDRNPHNMWLWVLIGMCCAFALLCPTIGDADLDKSSIPPTFHLTSQQKLVAAYILGIISALVLRPA